MAEPKAIVWTETAKCQRRQVLEYWYHRNKSASYPLKLIEVIRQRTQQIAVFPYSGVATDFPNTRIVSMGHYSSFYQIQTDAIFITAFWDNLQDPAKLKGIIERTILG